MNQAPVEESGIVPGAAIVIVLRSPREKCWGILGEINQAGVLLRGLDCYKLKGDAQRGLPLSVLQGLNPPKIILLQA